MKRKRVSIGLIALLSMFLFAWSAYAEDMACTPLFSSISYVKEAITIPVLIEETDPDPPGHDFSDIVPTDKDQVTFIPMENRDRWQDLSASEQALAGVLVNAIAGGISVEKPVWYGYVENSSILNIMNVVRDEYLHYTVEGFALWQDWYEDGTCDIRIDGNGLLPFYLQQEQYKGYVRELANSLLPKNCTKRDAVQIFNDWLIGHITYSADQSRAGVALDAGIGNCTTFSNLFKDMCNSVGIDCRIEAGWHSNGELHQWNSVNVEGQWYWQDVCLNRYASSNEYTLSPELFAGYIHCNRYG